MIVPSSAYVLKRRLSRKSSKEHQARGYTQARKEAAMAVIPDDPDSLHARLERMNQFVSLARQAARSTGWAAAARDMTDRHGTCADE